MKNTLLTGITIIFRIYERIIPSVSISSLTGMKKSFPTKPDKAFRFTASSSGAHLTGSQYNYFNSGGDVL